MLTLASAAGFVHALGLHDDPVFLTVFVLLSYRRLNRADTPISFGSTVLTVLISAACSQLLPHALGRSSPRRAPAQPRDEHVEHDEHADVIEMARGAIASFLFS